MLFLVCQGIEIGAGGKRRWLGAHWFRGRSYFKIGWKWVLLAVRNRYILVSQLCLSPGTDPQIASRHQNHKWKAIRFSIQVEVFRTFDSYFD